MNKITDTSRTSFMIWSCNDQVHELDHELHFGELFVNFFASIHVGLSVFLSRNREGTLVDHVLEIQKNNLAVDSAKKWCSVRILWITVVHEMIINWITK